MVNFCLSGVGWVVCGNVVHSAVGVALFVAVFAPFFGWVVCEWLWWSETFLAQSRI
jgi:hypothetical protein